MKPILARLIENPKAAKVITAALIWFLTWIVAKFGFSNGADWSAQIASVAAIVAAWAVAELRNWATAQNVRTIQQILPEPLKESGVANEATVAAVARLCQAAEAPQIAADEAVLSKIEEEQIRRAAD